MTETQVVRNHGRCVCGAITFQTVGFPERITVCHCLWCQRRTGTAFGTEAVFKAKNVVFDGSEISTYRHISDESQRWLTLHFCTQCGCNLGLTLELRQEIRSIPAGTYDDPGWLDSDNVEIRHVYTRSQRHWGDLLRAAKTFDGYFT